MTGRIPTGAEYDAYKGAHCHQVWARVGPHWVCPCCRRNKFQILRWTKRFPGKPNQFYGWMAGIHEHHDHSAGWDFAKQARFQRIEICDQCNSADGAAKRRLKLPSDFSFAPDEISLFVTAVPHNKHKLNYDIAASIYNDIAVHKSI